jgi:hypothetical protein
MSYNTFTPIVTDGLVLYLDAANTKSYPGTGTSWLDLSKNNYNGALNGAIFNNSNLGSISFDGINDFVQINTDSRFNFSTNNFTICSWVFFNSVLTTQIFISKYLVWTTNLDFVFRFNSASSKISFLAGDNIPIAMSTVDTISPLQWYYVSISRISGVTSIYLNGVFQTSHTGSVNIPNDRTDIRLGFSHDNDEPFNGKLSSILIYNTGLTSQQILQNYNATKFRYL